MKNAMIGVGGEIMDEGNAALQHATRGGRAEIEFAGAITEWTELLGREGVTTHADDLDRYCRSCSHEGKRPLAALFPTQVREVQEIMRIAQRHRIFVYPVSRGRNSGYGSASPSAERCVMLDLRRMNKIRTVNEELAYAVVEPGVTQIQMQEHLAQTGSRLWMDVTGAAPDSSLIGNLIERGFGLSPYGDRFQHSCCFQVVLPNGELFESGFGHVPNNKVAHLYKWGIGPYVDGLFTQSNLGIVTAVGLWLMPKPEAAEVVSISFKDDEHLLEAIERLRELKLRGLFPSAVHLANDLRVISVFEQYPFNEMGGRTPLSQEMLDRMKARWQVGAWNCIAGLWGSRSQVRSYKIEMRKALRGIVSPRFVSRSLLSFVAERPWLHWLPGAGDLRAKMGLLKLLEGIPSTAPQRAGYWRKRTAIPADGPHVERDACGMIWVSPIVPTTKADLARFMMITRSLCAHNSFETNVTVSLISDRALCCTVAILFDRALSAEFARAERCHEELLRAYLDAGYPPYRAGSDWGDLLQTVLPKGDPFVEVCTKFKHAVDPEMVLSPGRYGLG